MKKIEVGDIYEDCGFHPVRCTLSDGDDLEGVSLLDGSSPRSCSLTHCGVVKLTEEESDKLLDVWKTEGLRGVLIYREWGTSEQVDALLKEKNK